MLVLSIRKYTSHLLRHMPPVIFLVMLVLVAPPNSQEDPMLEPSGGGEDNEGSVELYVWSIDQLELDVIVDLLMNSTIAISNILRKTQNFTNIETVPGELDRPHCGDRDDAKKQGHTN